ncbi:hypothetical protein SRHO_G00087490 [Serrasalmus rhombeus]
MLVNAEGLQRLWLADAAALRLQLNFQELERTQALPEHPLRRGRRSAKRRSNSSATNEAAEIRSANQIGSIGWNAFTRAAHWLRSFTRQPIEKADAAAPSRRLS